MRMGYTSFVTSSVGGPHRASNLSGVTLSTAFWMRVWRAVPIHPGIWNKSTNATSPISAYIPICHGGTLAFAGLAGHVESPGFVVAGDCARAAALLVVGVSFDSPNSLDTTGFVSSIPTRLSFYTRIIPPPASPGEIFL